MSYEMLCKIRERIPIPLVSTGFEQGGKTWATSEAVEMFTKVWYIS